MFVSLFADGLLFVVLVVLVYCQVLCCGYVVFFCYFVRQSLLLLSCEATAGTLLLSRVWPLAGGRWQMLVFVSVIKCGVVVSFLFVAMFALDALRRQRDRVGRTTIPYQSTITVWKMFQCLPPNWTTGWLQSFKNINKKYFAHSWT